MVYLRWKLQPHWALLSSSLWRGWFSTLSITNLYLGLSWFAKTTWGYIEDAKRFQREKKWSYTKEKTNKQKTGHQKIRWHHISKAILAVRSQWISTFKIPGKFCFQPRAPGPANLSIKYECRMKTFSDMQKQNIYFSFLRSYWRACTYKKGVNQERESCEINTRDSAQEQRYGTPRDGSLRWQHRARPGANSPDWIKHSGNKMERMNSVKHSNMWKVISKV